MEAGNGEKIITGGGVKLSQPASVADNDRFAAGIAEAEEAAGQEQEPAFDLAQELDALA